MKTSEFHGWFLTVIVLHHVIGSSSNASWKDLHHYQRLILLLPAMSYQITDFKRALLT